MGEARDCLALGVYAKPVTALSADDRFAEPRFEWSDYDFSSGEPAGKREHTD
jgi:hypothetical protein